MGQRVEWNTEVVKRLERLRKNKTCKFSSFLSLTLGHTFLIFSVKFFILCYELEMK